MDGAEESKKNENGDSADLVYEFMKQEDDEEMELSLGLSMNGRFGVDPTKETLRRSSSLSDVFVTDNSVGNGRNAQARAAEFGSYAPLVRASSLPPELETQERRHQEVIQNPMVVNENGNCSGDSDGDGSHVDTNETPRLQEATRGSSSRESPHEPVLERRPAGVTSYRGDTSEGNIRNPIIDMPYVSTRGLGPENSQINGFLYRYRKGEDVKIVCVCHGLFLSPAEFVKHGGSGDVGNPLKHIVVTPFPF